MKRLKLIINHILKILLLQNRKTVCSMLTDLTNQKTFNSIEIKNQMYLALTIPSPKVVPIRHELI